MSTHTTPRRNIYDLDSRDRAARVARQIADLQGESVAIVELPHTWLGWPAPSTWDATPYGYALARGVAPERIAGWVHPHGAPRISDARMTALYAADLAARREREAARA